MSEAHCTDADRSSIAVMLHVDKDGLMNMLEIVKYDGMPIISPPSADVVELLPPRTRKTPSP